jgi:hypothetical protein
MDSGFQAKTSCGRTWRLETWTHNLKHKNFYKQNKFCREDCFDLQFKVNDEKNITALIYSSLPNENMLTGRDQKYVS